MTDSRCSHDDTAAGEATPSTLSRRRLLTVGFGAAAGLVALDRVAAAQANGGILGAAGSLQDAELAPAERIPPPTTTTTLPPIPDGQIMFPIGVTDQCFATDNFGDCRGSGCSRSHEGLDIGGTQGDPLFAVVSGRLTKKYVDRGLTYGAGHGWTLYDEDNDVTYKYFHMDGHADGLEEGDVVQQGDVIGYLGNTGTSGANSNSNYHLHFEYRPNNVAQDPRPLLVRPDSCSFPN